jgi:hypothetical protein
VQDRIGKPFAPVSPKKRSARENVMKLQTRLTRDLLWRGVITDTLSDKAEKNVKKLDKNVQKLFKHFPPKSERG